MTFEGGDTWGEKKVPGRWNAKDKSKSASGMLQEKYITWCAGVEAVREGMEGGQVNIVAGSPIVKGFQVIDGIGQF